jgi:hypothetical protein
MTATLPPHIRPSNLPALSECACFEPSASDFAEAGTDRHAALRAHFEGNDGALELLPEEDAEGVRWAADYIRVKAPLSDHPIRFEQPLSLILDDFSEINGTLDAVCHLDLFDLKWRERDYRAQLACYVLMRLQELGINATITVHVLYAAFRRAEVFHLDETSARAIVLPIIDRALAPHPQPTPCSYCGWCANRLTCSALNERAQAVAAGREDWKLQTYHASKITSPAEMAKALTLARFLLKWAEAVNFHARQMAIQKGVSIPGYELKSKASRSSCADVLGAFHATGLSAEDFLKCCDVLLNTSKSNPDKRGLADVLKDNRSISKAAATRELKRILQPFMRTPKDQLYLKALNDSGDETSTDEETTNA